MRLNPENSGEPGYHTILTVDSTTRVLAGSLDDSQKEHNRRVGSTRAKVENAIRRCKTFGFLRHRIRRIKSKARRTFCVITGFVNLHLLTRSYDTANTHRKTKKPGPKTPHNRG